MFAHRLVILGKFYPGRADEDLGDIERLLQRAKSTDLRALELLRPQTKCRPNRELNNRHKALLVETSVKCHDAT
ncbi:MAG: hypothetical protein ACK559_11390, partial [bacterium]